MISVQGSSAESNSSSIRGVISVKQQLLLGLLTMSFIPDDLIVDILTRLSVKSLLRFRCVSKHWCQLIKNPSFVQMHFQRSEENENMWVLLLEYGRNRTYYFVSYNNFLTYKYTKREEIQYPFKSPRSSFDILGYCDGLYCIRVKERNEKKVVTCIWNPSTKEYKEIPPEPELPVRNYLYGSKLYGFYYDSSDRDYKFVMVVDLAYTYVMIYTLGTNSWRLVTTPRHGPHFDERVPVYLNGALHWTACRPSNGNSILSFSLADEEFREVPPPDYDQNYFMVLSVLDGCLCVCCNILVTYSIDLWVMKDYGVRESWTKLFTLSQSLSGRCWINIFGLRLMKTLKNGELLLSNSLFLCKVEAKSVRDLRCDGDDNIYVGSLVSLNSGTYVENESFLGKDKEAKEDKEGERNDEVEEKKEKEDNWPQVSLSWWTDFPYVR